MDQTVGRMAGSSGSPVHSCGMRMVYLAPEVEYMEGLNAVSGNMTCSSPTGYVARCWSALIAF
jgi:hypothetical protein